MATLELKHIAPYLPYSVKGQSPTGNVFILRTHRTMQGTGMEQRTIETFVEDKYKLILRPLSELTRNIKIDRNVFVPIVELAKISDYDGFVSEIDTKAKNNIYGVRYIGDYEDRYVFAYHNDGNCFGLHNDNDQEMHIVLKQMECFQKMFEWHFDVFGLIENGLAIDINSIK